MNRPCGPFPSPSLSPVGSSLLGREPPIESFLCFCAVSSGFLLRHSRWTPTLNSVFSHHKTPEVFLCRCTVGLGTPSSGDGPGGSREGFPCFRGSPATAAARDFWQVFFRSYWMIGKRGGSRGFPFSLPSFRRVGEAEFQEDVLFPSSGSMDLRIRIRENFIRPFRLSSV